MVELVYICEDCEREYDKEWLLTQPRNEDENDLFQCGNCAFDGDDEVYAWSTFRIKVK